MANPKIKFMTDYVVSVVVSCIVKDAALPVEDAMKAFYNSQVFDRLLDAETGLYRESGGYVYELYKTEQKHGSLIQEEV